MDETREMTIAELAAKAEGADLMLAAFMDDLVRRIENLEVVVASLIAMVDPVAAAKALASLDIR